MAVNILTYDDLQHFKVELFTEMRAALKHSSDPPKKWLRSEEVKKLLKVSPGTLQTLRINGTLQFTKLGGIIFYDLEHIEKAMKENLQLAR